MSPQRHLARLAWPQVRDAAAQPGSTVVWPWGSVEQHGPHLPLGTDGLFAERVLDAVLHDLPAERPIWRLPLQAIGFSPEHQGFPGTLNLSAPLLIEVVTTVGRQLAEAGFQRLVLLNGHGGQIALLQTAARTLRLQAPGLGVLPCFLWSGPEGLSELIPAPERQHGLHAGLAETSLMLHLAPQQVGDQRPEDGVLAQGPPEGWDLEGQVPAAWLTGDLSSSGVIGNAAGASSSLGEALFGRLVSGWHRRFESLLLSDWPPIRPEPFG
nr:creatininase family protein [Cyanobacteriota bacterium]